MEKNPEKDCITFMGQDYRNFVQLQVLMNEACVVLRQTFRERWKFFKGEEWVEREMSGSDFMEIFGKRLFSSKSNLRLQKKSVEQGNTKYWDITTLCKILLEVDFGQKIGKTEHTLLQQLRNIRNKLAHHPTQIISIEEFNDNWKKISDVLLYFGYSPDALEEIRLAENIGSIAFKVTKKVNLENDREASQLRDKGNKAFREGDIDKALELYTKAIVLPELTDHILAILHSNRTSVYLKKCQEMPQRVCASDSNLQNAKDDAKKAVQLCPTWWKAHFKMGCVYQKAGNLKKAIYSFNQALGLDPSQQCVRSEKEFCQHKFEEYGRKEHLDPTNIPLSEKEQIDLLSKERGLQVLKESSIEEFEEILRKAGDPLADVWQAHRYRDGLDAPQNYELAAKLYTKAANKGNAEGLYNLALLTEHGKGVERDLKLAIQLLKQAAAHPPVNQFGKPNVGVAEAEHVLGLFYIEGVGFDYNPFKALTWYERASFHGSGNASNNLGCMYSKGTGVKKNIQRAVQYWKLAATRKNTLAMESLAYHYLEDKQPERAIEWFKRAMENGSLTAKMQKEEFEALATKVAEEVEKSEVVKWEKEHGLAAGNLTFQERLLRMAHALDPYFSKCLNFCFDLNNCSDPLPCSSGNRHNFDFHTVKTFAENGSETASKIFRAFIHFAEGLSLLENSNENDGIRYIAEGFRIEHIAAFLSESTQCKLLELIERRLEDEKCKSHDLDGDLHICYGYLRGNAFEETIAFLNNAINKFPYEICLYDLCASLHGFLKKFEEGLKIASKGVSLFPSDIELRYTKAALSRLTENASTTDIIRNYEEFLDMAPIDHRKVPESYYSIATCYVMMMTDKEDLRPVSDLDHLFSMVNKFYKLGLSSEEKQLPCFMPYSSTTKYIVENMLEIKKLGRAMKDGKVKKENSVKHLPEENLTIAEKMLSMTDPFRIEIVIAHREKFCQLSNRYDKSYATTQKPKHKQSAPLQLIGLKDINLGDMDPTKDNVYDGYVLQVTSIEDALTGFPSIGLIIEDKNGDVQRCFVYNFEQEKDVQEKIGYGCKISIINPYMRLAVDGKTAIRVDDRASLFLHPERAWKRCRFCGVDDATKKCSRCLRALYCSKECQRQDWIALKHKLICVKQITLPTCSGANITFL